MPTRRVISLGTRIDPSTARLDPLWIQLIGMAMFGRPVLVADMHVARHRLCHFSPPRCSFLYGDFHIARQQKRRRESLLCRDFVGLPKTEIQHPHHSPPLTTPVADFPLESEVMILQKERLSLRTKDWMVCPWNADHRNASRERGGSQSNTA